MSSSSTLLRSACRIASSSRCSVRYYSAAVASSSSAPTKPAATKIPVSSCKAGTVLKGLSILKDKPDPVALADEEYPAWLWTILDSTKPTAAAAAAAASDRKGKGKGRKAVEVQEVEAEQVEEESGPAQFDFVKERKKLRAANRASIKAANFLKTT